MNAFRRVGVLGTPVDAVDMSEALTFVEQRVRADGSACYVLAINPEKVWTLSHDATLQQFFQGAALLLPDGIGVVMAIRLLFRATVRRVPGADLMQEICALAPRRGYRLFIFGASEATNRRAVDVLRRRHQGIEIVGAQHGYIEASGMDDLVSRINAISPDILFVALGSPMQELWIQKHLSKLNVKVIQGIGGTLDVIAGTVPRAPSWIRGAGLEWLYRLVTQPTRARRQVALIRFTAQVLREKLLSARA